ncbi:MULTISPECIES: glucose-6-phosphate isomerase [unclassified Mesorhizobium]|uniref:glucose-6-phosphate isomerase n=1 Tax=unclassified Mesorhizobium TaxID=325217 RepID=UPI000BAF5013|nr:MULTISPECIES: glucose-6-phosphate isomerase [unclassified Mesorhizobium]PBB27127.1 glucose-6-phosphate isomerase [Mesorhizobium sp. WSM4304]PBB76729.1 glucose-6-phosphate isomerase [Mesorhizobium sp. WSM4308]
MDKSAFQKQLAALRDHRTAAPASMRQAFADDPQRFQTFSATDGDLLLDWSKCAVDAVTMDLLEKLAAAADLEGRRAAMFAGKKINITEDRAVLHTALRNLSGKGVTVDGQDVKADVISVLDAMGAFADAIRSGKALGATGKKITDIVNIGIGGSDLGPAMATLALAPYHDGPRAHYVSNIDGAHIHDTLKGLKAETTLFIVASKTFTTVETMTNAQTARDWVQKALGKQAVGKHFAAVSTALDLVAKFGIEQDRVFGFWDWVGGRYSVWGAIGLPVMIAVGPRNFRAFLDGAHEMDEHFRTAPLAGNLPALLGLVGWWHRVICGYPARAVIPYDQRLSRLPAYLQQLDMESNGKGVTLEGTPVPTPTGPLVWGEPGTNGQHAFFQLLHQGTDFIPVEFLAAAVGHEPELKHQHDLLLANCLAQSEALMKGRTLDEARAQMLAKGMKPADVDKIAPHRVFSGNRPSVTILYRKLDPRTFGRLIALYEHRVFVEGTLFNINSFDQWGVELGKELATGLLPVVEGKESAANRDASTRGLVERIHQLRGSE